jgi:hypothetical protein
MNKSDASAAMMNQPATGRGVNRSSKLPSPVRLGPY